MTLRLVAAALVLLVSTGHSGAATVSKTYSYFTIGGSTLEQIEKELLRRGPKVASTGSRHPGATRMEFKSTVGYAERSKRCSIAKASVSVKAKVILPRWKRPRGVETDVRLIWEALSSDIKRHEEAHILIAQSHARDLERALRKIPAQKDCRAAAARVKKVTDRILDAHDKAQVRFDQQESRGFEKRIIRLVEEQLSRM
jgi:predicted secreted Zn-dependent protease